MHEKKRTVQYLDPIGTDESRICGEGAAHVEGAVTMQRLGEKKSHPEKQTLEYTMITIREDIWWGSVGQNRTLCL